MDRSHTFTIHIFTPITHQDTLEDTIEDISEKFAAMKSDSPPGRSHCHGARSSHGATEHKATEHGATEPRRATEHRAMEHGA